MEELDLLEKIKEPILKWYQQNKRELPWRREKNPYFIWISEIMLQQTRIEAVMGYYERFLKSLPTVQDLAQVDEEKLLKLWEGLGYYNRARNLKKAAQAIQETYHGNIPKQYEELLKLPGIGEYTAGAIASIAFDEPVPAVDGNVLRVVSRVVASRKDVLEAKTKKEFTQKLQKIMPKQAGDFNEGLMELRRTNLFAKWRTNLRAMPFARNLFDQKGKFGGRNSSAKGKNKKKKRTKNGIFVGMSRENSHSKKGKDGVACEFI